MRILIAVFVVVVIALVALFAGGVFDTEKSPDPVDPPTVPDVPVEEEDPEAVRLHGPSPEDRPPLERYAQKEDTDVLLLVGVPQVFNAFLAQQWERDRNVDVVSWVAPPPAGANASLPTSETLPGALSAAPKAGLLDDEDIDVVVLHDFDPRAVEDDFWIEVAARVADGRLGLLAAPGQIHKLAMLEHPIVGRLLPVQSVKPVAGTPAPGAYGKLAAFTPTEAGKRHPASRLVQWPRWSSIIWAGTSQIATPWGTRFTYPVDELTEGAEALLRTSPERGDPWPVLIAGPSAKGRVLFFGAHALGDHDAYGRPRVVADWNALLGAWLAWLADAIPE